MNKVTVNHACAHAHTYIVPAGEANASKLTELGQLRCPKCIATTPTKVRIVGINRGKELASA